MTEKECQASTLPDLISVIDGLAMLADTIDSTASIHGNTIMPKYAGVSREGRVTTLREHLSNHSRDLRRCQTWLKQVIEAGQRGYVELIICGGTIAAIAVCLHRIADELVVWSSYEFRLVELADKHCDVSSSMPQKKNPDSAELIRGRMSTIEGDFAKMWIATADRDDVYARDALNDMVRKTIPAIQITGDILKSARFNTERMMKLTSIRD